MDYQDMAEVLVDMADEIIALTPDNARALAAKDYVEALRCTHELRACAHHGGGTEHFSGCGRGAQTL